MPRPRRAVTGSAFDASDGFGGSGPRRGIARPALGDRARLFLLPLAATAALGALVLTTSGSALVGAGATPTAHATVSALEVDVEAQSLTSRSSIVNPPAAPRMAQDAAANGAMAAQAKAAVDKAALEQAAADRAAAEEAAAAKAAAEKAAAEKAAAEKAAAAKSYAPASKYGLRGGAVKTYEAVMSRFSGINDVGGYRASSLSNHQLGLAIDFMLTPGTESELGWSIAEYLVAHASALNIDHIIFEQQIWTPSSPTWRTMEDRGSITDNHFDHVHVSMKR